MFGRRICVSSLLVPSVLKACFKLVEYGQLRWFGQVMDCVLTYQGLYFWCWQIPSMEVGVLQD